MQLDPGEVQIVKGHDFVVTDRRIFCVDGEIAVDAVSEPQIEETSIEGAARTTVMAIGGVLLFGGLIAQATPIWIVGGLICAFAPLAKVKRRGLAVTVQMGEVRKPIYKALNQNDAKLACAAIEEALRRSGA